MFGNAAINNRECIHKLMGMQQEITKNAATKIERKVAIINWECLNK